MISVNFLSVSVALFLCIVLSMNVFSEVEDLYAKGMHVVITGVGGGGTSPMRGGAGAAVIIDGKVLQFDAGPKTQENLMRSNVLPNHKIDYLFFTHLHVDHTSDFIYMRGWPGFVFNKGYQIYGPYLTKAMSEAALDFNALHHEEMDAFALKFPKLAPAVAARDLRFPPITEIKPSGGVVLHTDNITVTAARTPHMMSENGYSFAYRVDSNYGSVVISGDTVPSLDVIGLAKNAELLIHDAIHLDDEVLRETFFKFGESTEKLKTNDKQVHSYSTEVGKVAQQSGVKKLVTYHHQYGGLYTRDDCRNDSYSNKNLEWSNGFIAAIRQEYDGEIFIGAPCMTFTIAKP